MGGREDLLHISTKGGKTRIEAHQGLKILSPGAHDLVGGQWGVTLILSCAKSAGLTEHGGILFTLQNGTIPAYNFFPKNSRCHSPHLYCAGIFNCNVMYTLPSRKMKEWDQNDVRKGARIYLPAIQQSVKGKAFPEAAISPLAVTSNSSCFRRAKMSRWYAVAPYSSNTHRIFSEKGNWAIGLVRLHFSLAYLCFLHYLIFQPV